MEEMTTFSSPEKLRLPVDTGSAVVNGTSTAIIGKA